MTRREFTDAMLLDDAHPERWSESDRDAYIRWRLAESAAWFRSSSPKAMRLTTYRTIIRESVARILEERQHLYSPRYRKCVCARCRPPAVTQAELDAFMAQHPMVVLHKATVGALVEIERFRPRAA